jgi:hypothetical protein
MKRLVRSDRCASSCTTLRRNFLRLACVSAALAEGRANSDRTGARRKRKVAGDGGVLEASSAARTARRVHGCSRQGGRNQR